VIGAFLLVAFFCGHRLDDQGFKDLIDGFMGEIDYEGDFVPFWPYIRLGEYVHVGKGSSFVRRYEVA
jgi:hypothetical protein